MRFSLFECDSNAWPIVIVWMVAMKFEDLICVVICDTLSSPGHRWGSFQPTRPET